MRKISQAMNGFRMFGMNVGQMAVLVGLVISVWTLSDKISAGQEAKVQLHNSGWVGTHPYLQCQIDSLRAADLRLTEAIMQIRNVQDTATELIISEIRKMRE